MIASFDKTSIIANALSWMRARGWHRLLAKRSHFEQSLLEHSLLELDALLELLPTLSLPNHYDFSQQEQEILCVAVLVHDTGKEAPAWQAYVQGKGKKVGHIDLDLTLSVVPEVCTALNLSVNHQHVHELIARCAEFHHNRPARSDGDILAAMFGGATERFQCLAHVVKGIDHLCSASTAADAVRVVRRDAALSNHIKVALHQTKVRGISTVLLHAAAREAFLNLGWKPLLYFKDSTVYVRPAEESEALPPQIQIEQSLRSKIENLLSKDVVGLIIGSPQANILPKPDLVKFDETRSYLRQAANRIGSQSFAKKAMEKRRDVVQKYWVLIGKQSYPSDEEVNSESMNISVAQPEMIVLKAFKALITLCCTSNAAESLASQLYEQSFGSGSWKHLKSTSTLMPAKDMAELIDPFWILPGTALGYPAVSRLKQLSEQQRVSALIERLTEIVQEVCAAHGAQSPRSALADKMSSCFLQDLVEPKEASNWQEMATLQEEHYSASKLSAGKLSPKALYLCPICNQSFSGLSGTKASADFIDKPESHTNRATSLGSFDSIIICNSCYYEKLLMQLACGEKPQELIYVIPQLNLGPRHGELLVEKVRTWVSAAQLQLSGEGDSTQAFYLNVIQTPARKILDKDPLFLTEAELVALFMNRISPDKQKDRQKKVIVALKEEFDDDLSEVNARSGLSFSSWEEAAVTVLDKSIDLQEFALIRREIFRSANLHLVCETPNLILVPLAREISGVNDESEISKALRKLFIALALGLAFNARVAIKKEGDGLEPGPGTGCAYVAPLPALRALIEAEWIPIPDALMWLRAIGSASLLSRDTKFPERNALFQVLSADPAEWIVRRIEQASDSGIVTMKQIELIEQLPNFTSRKTEVKRL